MPCLRGLMISRLAIFGSGPVAHCAALTAHMLGFDAHLVEDDMAPTTLWPGPDPRAWSLRAASLAFLRHLGLSLTSCAPVTSVEVWHSDAAGTPLEGHLHFTGSPTRPLAGIIPAPDLRTQIQTHLDKAKIRRSRRPLGDPFVLRDQIGADLALICDSLWMAHLPPSQRPKMVGWPYGHVAFTAPVTLGRDHEQTARQVFLPSGPLALLPLSDPRAASLIWSMVPRKAKAAQLRPDLAHQASVALNLPLHFDPAALAQFPLHAHHARTYVGAGFAILGDGAHRIHPLAGQGLNLGFADIGALFDTLVSARRVGADLSTSITLQGYERRRRFQNEAMYAAMDQLKILFANNWGPLRLARGLGMHAFNASPLKTHLQNWMSDESALCEALIS